MQEGVVAPVAGLAGVTTVAAITVVTQAVIAQLVGFGAIDALLDGQLQELAALPYVVGVFVTQRAAFRCRVAATTCGLAVTGERLLTVGGL